MRINIVSTIIEVCAKCHKNTKERQVILLGESEIGADS